MAEPGLFPVIEAAQDPPTYESAEQTDQMLASLDIELLDLEITNSQPSVSTARALLSPQMVSAILMMDKQAPEGAKIIYEELHGLGWQDTRGWYVYFGDVNDIDMKAKIYTVILNRLQETERGLNRKEQQGNGQDAQ